MMKFISLLSVLFACGAPLDGEEGLGQTQQAYVSRNSTNYQWGVRDAQSRTQCNRTNAGQTCVIPSAKGGFYCLGSTLTASEKTIARNVYSQISNALIGAGYAAPIWQEGPDPLIGSCQMVVDIGTVPGAAGSNIESYSNIDFGISLSLTEGASGGTPVGNYVRHIHDFGFTDGFTTIDRTDIDAKCPTSAGRQALFQHALGHAVWAWHGLGSRTDSLVNTLWLRKSVAACGTLLNGSLTAGASCLIHGGISEASRFNLNGDFSATGAVCAGD